MSTEQREVPLDQGAIEHKDAGEMKQGGPAAANVGEPATPAKPGAVEIAAAPATARRGRPRDEDQPAPADSHAEGQAAEQPDSQGEQDEQAPAKRRKVAPQDPAAGRALGSVGTWRRGEAAERRKAAEAAEQAAREQRYREAFEKYQSVGAELRSLEDKRVTRVKAAQEEAEERDERLVESFLSRYTASGRYRPALLAAIVGHPYCRGQLLEVLRKEPPSEHEYLQRITVERLYAEAVAEAETAAAKAAAADAEAGAEAGAEAAAAEAAVVVEVAAE